MMNDFFSDFIYLSNTTFNILIHISLRPECSKIHEYLCALLNQKVIILFKTENIQGSNNNDYSRISFEIGIL